MDVSTIAQSNSNQPGSGVAGSGFESLTSQEFFKLMITDLLNQDPLQPTDNEKLLEQIALIRDIEMNNEVTTSMRSLIEQQRLGSAATLIGRYVEGSAGNGEVHGVVTAVRFDQLGTPFLMLDNGKELPLSNLLTVTSLQRLADSLVGKMVTAVVIEDGEPQTVEGVVTEVKSTPGAVMLELDTGQQVPLTSVTQQQSVS